MISRRDFLPAWPVAGRPVLARVLLLGARVRLAGLVLISRGLQGSTRGACLTEFGHTLQENGGGGTDHGHGSVLLLAGGGVKGGRVYGEWPGLAPQALYEGRDLAVATDFRRVAAEAVARHLSVTDLAQVFPGGPWAPLGLLG